MASPKKILIVDDNRTIVKALAKRLASAGYDVVPANSGKEALRLAMNELPDLVISDVDMPEMDGGELAAKLKTIDQTSTIPVMFLTGLITDGDDSMNTRENIYISKSCKAGELFAAIRRII